MALRFAVSPLWETIAGLRVLAAPECAPVHQRWTTWAESRLGTLPDDPWFRLLHRLATRGPVVPEFLIPTPGLRSTGIDTEVDALFRATPERITAAVGADPHARPLLDDPTEALTALRDRVRAVHDAIIEPLWPRLEGVLQGDVERRGRRLTEHGGPTVLGELHDTVTWHPTAVEVAGTITELGTRDLVLVPSAFIWPDVYLRDSPVRLALCYPATGFGTLWTRPAPPARPALTRLLGATRARLLHELERPSTVSELAERLGVTVGAVSQHLGVLRETGLAVSRREGREVVSLRTALGLALVQGGD
ncbi:ArsR/SmtB family transcription factor [Umezawaea sp.]|uniref:ArsR/SmtB family transcription factor n=1 Tax=Umezawaea sp. TaxID=1955258 RepID=UPI002ED2DB5E